MVYYTSSFPKTIMLLGSFVRCWEFRNGIKHLKGLGILLYKSNTFVKNQAKLDQILFISDLLPQFSQQKLPSTNFTEISWYKP